MPLREHEKEDHIELNLNDKPIDLDLFNNDLSLIWKEKFNESTTSISCKGSEIKVMKMLGHITAKRPEVEQVVAKSEWTMECPVFNS